MDWAEKWYWILDAIIAVPGLRYSDLKWLADLRGNPLWDAQMARVLKVATTRRLITHKDGFGYCPTFGGIHLLDEYKADIPSDYDDLIPTPSFEGAGKSVGFTMSHNYARSEQLLEAATATLAYRERPSLPLIEGSSSLALRGIFKSATFRHHVTPPAFLSSIVKNRFISMVPFPELKGWTEFWVELEDDISPTPILTIQSAEQAKTLLAVLPSFLDVHTYLIVVAPTVRLSDDSRQKLWDLGSEIVVIED